MNAERDKFLTEAMGICFWLGHDCPKCADNTVARRVAAINFSTWDGFGKLWSWSREQDWWVEITDYYWQTIDIELINPDKFANAVYECLKAAEGR